MVRGINRYVSKKFELEDDRFLKVDGTHKVSLDGNFDRTRIIDIFGDMYRDSISVLISCIMDGSLSSPKWTRVDIAKRSSESTSLDATTANDKVLSILNASRIDVFHERTFLLHERGVRCYEVSSATIEGFVKTFEMLRDIAWIFFPLPSLIKKEEGNDTPRFLVALFVFEGAIRVPAISAADVNSELPADVCKMWSTISDEMYTYFPYWIINLGVERANGLKAKILSKSFNMRKKRRADLFYLTNSCNKDKHDEIKKVLEDTTIATLYVGRPCDYDDWSFIDYHFLNKICFENGKFIFSGLEIYMYIVYCVRNPLFDPSMYSHLKSSLPQLKNVKDLSRMDSSWMESFIVVLDSRLFSADAQMYCTYANAQTYGFRNDLSVLRSNFDKDYYALEWLRDHGGYGEVSGHMLYMLYLMFLCRGFRRFFDLNRWLLLMKGNVMRYGTSGFTTALSLFYDKHNQEPESRQDPDLWHTQDHILGAIDMLDSFCRGEPSRFSDTGRDGWSSSFTAFLGLVRQRVCEVIPRNSLT